MFRYLLVSLGSGLLFGVLDALLNANPLAVRLFAVYKPIARSSVNPLAGMAIDIAYGFIMAGIFLLLYESLPGGTGVLKGLSFVLLAWFFRVVMQAASTWIMFEVPLQTIGYSLAAGLLEMVLIGLLYGLSLKPFSLQ
jgi:hypothetical protein